MSKLSHFLRLALGMEHVSDILYSFLPKLYGFSSEHTTFLPNLEISSGLFYFLSDPKLRISERDLSYPKKVPMIVFSDIRDSRA